MNSPLSNLEAECCLLGALLLSSEALEVLPTNLLPCHFSNSKNGDVFAAISKVRKQGRAIDPVLIRSHLNSPPPEMGWQRYLIHLATSPNTKVSVEEYCALILDSFMRRRASDIAKELLLSSSSEQEDRNIYDIVNIAKSELHKLELEVTPTIGMVSLSTSLDMALAELEQRMKCPDGWMVSTGFIEIDKLIGGLQKTSLIVLAGRPAMGKTSLAVNIALNVLESKHNISNRLVAVFSLEMAHTQLSMRAVSSKAKISTRGHSNMSIDDFLKIKIASDTMKILNLHMDDSAVITVNDIAKKCKMLRSQGDLSLIIVDYLQMVSPNGKVRNSDTKSTEISDITRGLKRLAKELNVPVIALSQLSRASETRASNRPVLSDLRDSGAIEQDADCVLFVYRESYYEAANPPKEGTAAHNEWQRRLQSTHNTSEVIVAKNRHGPTGTAKLFFDPNFTQFENLGNQYE